MDSEKFQNQNIEKLYLDHMKWSNDCKVSKASTELMLYRFANGKEIDFPFQNN